MPNRRAEMVDEGSPTQGRRDRSRLGTSVLVALLVHVNAVILAALVAYRVAPRKAELAARMDPGDAIGITTLDDETARKLLAELEREEERAREEKEQKERESPRAPGQVVDIPKPVDEKRPDDARFVAEHDSSVPRETKRYGTAERPAGRPAPPDPEPRAQATPPSPPASPGSGSEKTPGLLAMREPTRARPGMQGPGTPSPGTRIIGPGPEKEPGTPGPEETLPAPGGGGGAPAAPPMRLPGVHVPLSPAQAAASGNESSAPGAVAGTQDHLPDVDEGDETALNAKQWKYAAFFNRVKDQVRTHWRPGEEYQKRDPNGVIYGGAGMTRHTLLRIHLNLDGSLRSVTIDHPSGVEFLDDVAIEAVKRAQPFPNPPRQIADSSGVVSFQFGFFFEVSAGRPKMKVFRYSSM